MTTIVTKNGSGAPLASDLVQGELAVDLTNKRLYTEDSGGTVIEVGTSPSTIDINAGTIDGTVIGGASAAAGTFTTFTSTGIDDNATSTAITIDSSQNVGIGTASPSSYANDNALAVVGSSNGVISVASSAGSPGIFFRDSDSPATQKGYVQYDVASNWLRFATDGAERMRIDAGGSVLIGKTTPTDLHNTWNHLIIGEKGAIISENGAGGIDGITVADNAYIDADTGTYAYQTTAAASKITQTGGVITFDNAGSGTAGAALTLTERMRIDSSGNVGIGTSSPAEKLEVAGGKISGSTVVGRTYTLSGVSSANPNYVNGTGFNDVPVKVGDVIVFPFGQTRTVTAVTNTQLTVSSAWSISFAGSTVTGYSGLGFETNGSERMRIDSSGNLLVGTTSAISSNHIIQGPSSGITLGVYRPQTGAGAGVLVVQSDVGGAGTTNCVIYADGDVENTNNSYTGISDVSLKENIVDASPQLDDIMAMRVRSYNLKSTGAKHIGVIAQELEQTSPELVKTGEDGIKSVKYSVMYMKAIKALQEAVTRIETLEAEVAALKGA